MFKEGCFRSYFTFLVLLFSVALSAQNIEIKGNVIDMTTQLPLEGVSVQIEGTTIGTTTNSLGQYSISVKEDSDFLIFSMLGYDSEKVRIDGQRVIDVILFESSLNLNEMVVIGYGTTTKKEVTGSVSSLKSEDFSKGTFTDASGLLQGKVAGLTVINPNGGDPNGKFEILLRGTNTLSAGQGPLIIIDGVVGGDMRNINFQEVESIDVLKDGSAAAIYGTRGTNGVVIITTKRAKAGKTTLEYDGQVTVQSVQSRAIPFTASQFAEVIRLYKPSMTSSLYGGDTDWFDEITRTPISHKHSLALSGGSDTFSHRTVLNVEQNQGIQIGNRANKYLVKSNIHQDAIKGWLTLDYNLYMSKRDYVPANYSAFEQAFFHNPTEPVYDESDKISGGYFRVAEMGYFNPVAMIKERKQERTSDNIGSSVRATLNVLAVDGLKWDNFLSYSQQRYESRDYKTRYYPSSIGKDGEATISNEYSYDYQWETTLNYTKSFMKHNLQAILGYTYQYGMYQTSSQYNYGFDTDRWLTHNIGAGEGLKEGLSNQYSYKEDHTYIAFFGRVMYNYDQKYLLSVSLRRDGSSRFGDNNKWGWFPAVSLGWRLDREEWLKNVSWLSDLKVRAGYGVTGNQDFDSYKSRILMGVSGKFLYNGKWINTYAPVSNANPDLGWEKKSEFNVGVDFAFFNSRLRGAIDYYYRLTTDLLYTYSVPSPPYVYNKLFTNVGTISNQGVEVTISGDILKKSDFTWGSSLIFSTNRNKLITFTSDEFKNESYKVGWLNTPLGVYCQRLEEGKSLGSFFGPIWEGVDPATGEDKLKNAQGSKVPEEQWEYLGSAYPFAQLSWNNSFRYKNWDLNLLIRGSVGGKVFNTMRGLYENIATLGLKNSLASWLDDTSFTGGVKYSSKYLEDASYMKVDNLSLGYTFDFKNSLVRYLRLNLTAQNLLTITSYSGVDPEVALSGLTPGIESTSYYPRTTSITFGANLLF